MKLKPVVGLEKAERKAFEKPMPSGGIPWPLQQSPAPCSEAALGTREQEQESQTTAQKSIQREAAWKPTANFFLTQSSEQGQQQHY